MTLTMPIAFGNVLIDLLIAIIILLLGFVAGRIFGALLNKMFSALSPPSKSRKKMKSGSFGKGFSSFISICIYIIAVILALEQVGVTTIVLKAILVILIIIVLGTILFSVLDFITNLFFGLNMLASGKFKKGDIIKIRKIEGTIERIGLAHTKIKTSSGDIFIIPNILFFRRKVSNNKEK